MTRIAMALAALLFTAPAVAEVDTLVECGTFKSRWSMSVGALLPGRPAFGYGPVDRRGLEPVSMAPDIEARLRCDGGNIVHIEMKPAGAGSLDERMKPFLVFAVASVMALDPQVGDREAAALIEALRAEARGRDAESVFGPYVMVYRGSRGRDNEAFTIDQPQH